MNWRRYISSNSWGYNLLAFVALVIPLHRRLVPAAVALAFIFSLYRWVRGKCRPRLKGHLADALPLLGLLVLYVMLLAGLAFTSDVWSANREVEYKLSFVVFPLLALLLPPLSRLQLDRLLTIFTTGCGIFLVASVATGACRAMLTGDWRYLSYEDLSAVFHPSYMSAYQTVALFHVLDLGRRGEWLGGSRKLHVVLLLLIPVYIAMLASRAGMLGALIVLGYFAWSMRDQYPGRRRSFMHVLLAAALLVASSLALPVTQKRLTRITHNPAAGNNEPARGSSELRMVAWQSGWSVLVDHPLGLGTGNVQRALEREYARTGEVYAYRRGLNAHCQYLQTALELGWFGLSVLVFCLLTFLWRVWRAVQPALAAIAGLVLFHALVESFLEVQAGIIFTAFWMLCAYLSAQARVMPAGSA